MSKNFLESLEKMNNLTETENGAVALKSTNSDLVDLFTSIGVLRSESVERIENKFIKAFYEDRLLAMKILAYARDVRGGLGERKTPKVIYNYLANNYTDILIKNLEIFVEIGRWDDIIKLIDCDNSKLTESVVDIIKKQLKEDYNSEYPSLLCKWLPSENTSSKETVSLANKLIKLLDTSPRQYRKMLSSIRKKLNIVEQKMSNNNWTEIEYSKVPSKAMNIYRNAFWKHDETGFKNYIDSLQKGETKINSSTLYPYDIIGKIIRYGYDSFQTIQDVILEEQWKVLPNYVEGENNILIMADTSGSMTSSGGRPIHTSLGLAIYFAERNKGYYNNKFMTFSSRPSFVELKGNTLAEKIRCIPSIIEDTNLESGFKLILNSAIQNNISQDEMPKSLVVISDMQFNSATGRFSSPTNTWFDTMKEQFHRYGYEMPNIVFWNVAGRKDSFQTTCEHKGVQLVSGQSTAIFKTLLQNIGKTPYQAMLDTINVDRYSKIKI